MLALATKLAVAIGSAQATSAQDMPATNRIAGRLADGSPIGLDALQRLALIQASIGRAVPRALVSGNAPGVDLLTEALTGWPLPPDRAMSAITGDWSCLVLTLRREAGVTISHASLCRVTEIGTMTSGTGLDGRIHNDGEALLWLGEPSSVAGQVVGVLQVTSKKRARIYVPAPDRRVDSLDIILMRRSDTATPGR